MPRSGQPAVAGIDKDRNRELAAIHTAWRRLGLTEEAYREYLEAWTWQSSAAKLTQAERHRVIENLRKMGFERKAPPEKLRIEKDDRPQAQKIKAMWLELHELGAVRDPSLRALNAYVKRMAKVDHVNWLTPKQAGRLIESLKRWVERVRRTR